MKFEHPARPNGRQQTQKQAEEDRFLVCIMARVGYGRWEWVKREVRSAWQFRFDWFLKSRTPLGASSTSARVSLIFGELCRRE